jgi:tetratricopeptide (TPR) repeat protein
MFRELLADRLETMSQVLQALDNEPKALETVTEAAAIYSDLNGKRPDRYPGRLARTLLRRGALLANMGRHGEALAAIEPAVQVYRRLTIKDRNAYLPSLAEALTRQADELGHLDRITEARAAIAEAEMISTDMLPSTQS